MAAEGLKVCVVEDDEAIAEMVARIFTSRGHVTTMFNSPDEALRELQPGNLPDVLVLDFNLPGMTGDVLYTRLVERFRDGVPPCIVMSASGDEATVGRALDNGAVFFVQKPFSTGQLLAMVERAAQRRPKSGPITPQPPERFTDEISISVMLDEDAAPVPPAAIGAWSIVRELGRGGMGVVYLAHNESTGMDAALKVLGSGTMDDLLRFRREFDILAGLNHPVIVPILGAGTHGGRMYYVMEYVEGPSIDELVKESGALPWRRAVELLRPVADALDYLQGKGLVHRDVKPGNIVIDKRGSVRLVDFGLARRSSDTSLTQHSQVYGTPGYMPPDVLRGGPTTSSWDVFSLAVTAYKVITGQHPLVDSDILQMVVRYSERNFPSLREAAPDVPESLGQLVYEAMDADPAKRPSARAMAEVMRALLES